MAIDTVLSLLDALRAHRLLGPEQLQEVAGEQGRFTDAVTLAKELVQRGWLTPFQVNLLFQGHGADLVLGQYVLLDRIGEGGMGQVFKARHLRLDRVVALKVIRQDRLTNAEAVGRFQREIQLVAQLTHPNVVLAFDASFSGEGCYLSMEYVEGTDLGRLVKQKGPLPVEEAREYVRQAALGLQHAHEHGMVHRDIKPSNLLLASGGTIKLLDLGLARLRQAADDDNSATFTQMGTVVGTPDFISPEQARNAHKADIRSDLYSLGCTFWFLLAGKSFVAGKTATEKLFSQCFDDPPPIETLRPEVPPGLSAILRKLTAKKPEERFQTPAELAEALRVGRIDNPSYTTPVNVPVAVPVAATELLDPSAEAPPGRRRSPPWLLINAAGGLLLIGLIALFMMLLHGSEGTPAPSRPGAQMTLPVRSVFDALEASAIPEEERPSGLKEVVAVLGKHRRRHWGQAYCVAFSPDGKRIATGGSDRTVRLWDAADLHELAVLRAEPAAEVRALAFAPDGRTLAAGSGDGIVRLWDVTPGSRARLPLALLRSLANYPILSIAFTPDGKLLAAGGSDWCARLWTVQGPPDREKPLALLRGHKSHVYTVAFARQGQVLASASGDGTIQLSDVKDAGVKDPLVIPAHEQGVYSLSVSPDGQTLASFGADRIIRFWNAADGRPASTAPVKVIGGGGVLGLSWGQDGKSVAYLIGMTVYRVDLASPASAPRRLPLDGHPQDPRALVFSPDGKTAATVGDITVRLWDATTGKERATGDDRKAGGLRALAQARDGQLMATGGWDRSLRLWEFGSAAPVERLAIDVPETNAAIDTVALTPDGRLLATGGPSSPLRLWDLSHGKPDAPVIPRGGYWIAALAFSRDGQLLLSAGTEPAALVRLWQVSGKSAREKTVFKGHDFFPVAVAFSPDGKRAASAAREPTVRVWDLESDKVEKLYCARGSGGGHWVYDLAFSPDGRRLATASSDRVVRLWDLGGAEPRESVLTEAAGPSGSPTGLAWAPDGHLVAVSWDGRVSVIDVPNRRKAWERELPGMVQHVAFAPDGRHILTVNGNGTIYVFRLPAAVGR